MQTKKTAPFDATNNTKQDLHPISSIRRIISKYKDCSCALTSQKQWSICFWLAFFLFLSFGQTKERKELRPISTFKRNSLFSFSLDGKRNKKIKAKPNAPPVLPTRPQEEYINCNYPLLLHW